MKINDPLPPLTPNQFDSLRVSIQQNGVSSPIVVDQDGDIVDGSARRTICTELNIECPRIVEHFDSEFERLQARLEYNVSRRQLSSAHKRKVIASYLKQDTAIANNFLGEILGVSENTVKSVRELLEATSQIAKLEKFRGKDGRVRRRHQRIFASNRREERQARKIVRHVPEGNQTVSVSSAKRHARQQRTNVEPDRGLRPPTNPICKLYNCRFQDLVEQGHVGPNSARLVLTDPPYNKDWLPQWDDLGEFAEKVLQDGGLLVTHCGLHFLPEVMNSLSKHLTYRWMLSTSWKAAGNRQFIGGNSVLNKWLPILVFSKGTPNFPNGFSDSIRCEVQEKKDHEWQQPVEVFEQLVAWFSEPGDLVIDPCAGSFTTAVACQRVDAKRQFIGADIDPVCIDTGDRRLCSESAIETT